MYIKERLESLKFNYFPKDKEYRLASYLLDHLNRNITLSDVCLDLKISKPTIVRFAQNAGFDGFPSFWKALQNETNFWSQLEKNRIRSLKPSEPYPNFLDSQFRMAAAGAKKVIVISRRVWQEVYRQTLLSLSSHTEMYFLSSWNLAKEKEVLESLNEKDVVIVIEPRLEVSGFITQSLRTEPLFHSVITSPAKKYYFGPGKEMTGFKVVKERKQ